MYLIAFVSGGTAEYPGFNQMHQDSGRHIFYTLRNEVRGGGYIGFTLSVCLSVCPSVR